MTESRILILDDDPSVRRVLTKQLNLAGYEEVEASGEPERVLDLFDSFKPDLLILDLNMPKVDGFQVLELLRERDPEAVVRVPVIVLTGEGGRDNKLKALQLGARDFLTKPCDRVELNIRVRGYLEIRHLQRRLQMQNQQLDRRVRERSKKLEEAKFEIIQRLMTAAEYRDDPGGNHVGRVSQYCELVALAYGLDEFQADLILWASPMHDIGKIAIPDRILLKPGPLTPEEREEMTRHCEIGAELLRDSDSEALQLAESIALTHHEKWDGSGYPRGLKGDEIPIEGRIMAVADVFDALTCKRPYKEAWAIDKAVEEIKSLSGTHFDPAVVEAFMKALPGIEGIARAFADKSAV